MEKRIALVTCSKYPDLTPSDRLLAGALRYFGANAAAVDWRDCRVDWKDFAIAVVRSTWDYHLHTEEFAAWIDSVEHAPRLVNAPAVLRWNSNKRYLVHLRNRSVPMLPFFLVEPDGELPYRDVERSGWSELVLKPLVGASAWHIARTTPKDLSNAVTLELRRSGYLIQPFAHEVASGEYSIIFFDGRFSHAVLKKPAAYDFRTQPELGASITIVKPDASLVTAAAGVIDALPECPTYARIDGILQNGRFLLMEAELIEPELFFHLAPDAAGHLAEAILKLA